VLPLALSARPDIVNRFFHEARRGMSISDPEMISRKRSSTATTPSWSPA
jgi:hypothetical protein